ncbi:uncharacterized protein K02A2.6-like [Stomoxys calcitrans]|uniref:uncharacterized protein K02A2.6-like n=1 Tax=Stomoxys calcitrans TaxID=35570 RepID=UPI0027E282D8|nr:uncharacterized protein K02A2.6-like [Stomoxys calcitrans]
MVVKPHKVRLCLDARKINAVTKKDAYPLPSIEGIFSRLPKANIITKLDIKDAYWQIELDEESRPITAFTVPGRPLYQFVVMPFGMCNAPQTMSRLMDELGKPAFSESPFQRLYIDLLGPYSRSKSGHIGLLIVLDHHSKFHCLHPMRKFTSIFHCYGVPETVVSDNGSQFKANDLNAYFTSLGIKHMYTALYSPQVNASERMNRSLIAGIRAYLKGDHTRWDENLSAISCALRNSIHQAIRMSPYHALYGFDMITHGSTYSLLRRLNLLDEPTCKLSKDDNLQIIRKDIQKHIKDEYDANQWRYNLRTRNETFKIGQEILR